MYLGIVPAFARGGCILHIKSDIHHSDIGFWAVLGRLLLVFMVFAVLYASFSPENFIPHILYSYHLEHFAIFYLFALSASAAFVRRDVLHIGVIMWTGAMVIEAIRWLQPAHRDFAILDWFADAAGVLAALAPVGIGRFRSAFQKRG
jgi:hypothetical protein